LCKKILNFSKKIKNHAGFMCTQLICVFARRLIILRRRAHAKGYDDEQFNLLASKRQDMNKFSPNNTCLMICEKWRTVYLSVSLHLAVAGE